MLDFSRNCVVPTLSKDRSTSGDRDNRNEGEDRGRTELTSEPTLFVCLFVCFISLVIVSSLVYVWYQFPGVGEVLGWRQPLILSLYLVLLLMKECLNCSLECNSSNGGIASTLLLQFLQLGMWSEACFAHSAGCPSIAVLLGAAHPL